MRRNSQKMYLPLAEYDDLADFEIVQPLLCQLQVDLGDRPELADTVRFLDGTGTPLKVAEYHGVYLSHGMEAHLAGGKSGVLRVVESARMAILLREGEEVLQIAVALDPDERTLVTP